MSEFENNNLPTEDMQEQSRPATDAEANAVQPTAQETPSQPTEQAMPQQKYVPVNPRPVVRRPVSQPYAPYQAPQQANQPQGYRPSQQAYVPTAYINAPIDDQIRPSQTSPQPPQNSQKQPSGMGKLIAGIVIGVVAVAVVSISSIGIYSHFTKGNAGSNASGTDFSLTMAESPQTDTTITGNEEQLTPAQVAAKVRPSIVSVITKENVNGELQENGEGSGIILRSDGYIVTNSHVIGDSKKYNVSVITSDGTTYEATVIGYDTRSDLAVLKINAKDLPACELGDSSKLVLGDYVIAIGNPGGVQFAGSITDGIVSGIDRIIDTTDMESTSAMRYIQTNAAINPGNSGGALVNMYGQVIGVNTSKISADGYEGMGFAIPSVTVKEVVDDLINYGYVQGRVKLGITCTTISSAYESQGIPAGLQIYSIDAESDLNGKAQVYDIITHCDGKRIEALSQLQDIIFEKKAGDTIELTLYRPSTSKTTGSSYTVKIKLLEDTGTEEEEETTQSNDSNSSKEDSDDDYSDFFEDFFGGGRNY